MSTRSAMAVEEVSGAMATDRHLGRELDARLRDMEAYRHTTVFPWGTVVFFRSRIPLPAIVVINEITGGRVDVSVREQNRHDTIEVQFSYGVPSEVTRS